MASGLDLQCAELSYLPIPPCAKAIPTAALPWEKPMYSVCGSQAVYSHNKHNTIASVACFESFVSPRTWLMLSTQLPPIHGAAVGARQMYSHRLSVLISFLHAHATLTRLQLHHLARSQDRAFLGTYGCLHSAPLAEYCIPASAPFCTNLLNPPKHWRGLLPYWLMSGSLFPQTGPQTLATGFWRQADARTFQHHVDLFPCICR